MLIREVSLNIPRVPLFPMHAHSYTSQYFDPGATLQTEPEEFLSLGIHVSSDYRKVHVHNSRVSCKRGPTIELYTYKRFETQKCIRE